VQCRQPLYGRLVDGLSLMTFHSVLCEGSDGGREESRPEAPAFFRDSNLDQLVERITADWKDDDLTPLYYAQLNNLDAITYRQSVMQDLEEKILMQAIKSFSVQMRAMRERLSQRQRETDSCFCRLHAAGTQNEHLSTLPMLPPPPFGRKGRGQPPLRCCRSGLANELR
jgi:hypothetical protein